MDRRTSGNEVEFAVRGALCELIRHVAVFDDLKSAAGHAEVAELFMRVRFGEHDAAHFRMLQIMQTKHQRIGNRNQRIVHLEIGDVLYSEFFHEVETAGFPERKERSAMSVRSQGNGVLRRHQHSAGIVDCRHEALRKEVNGLRIESEAVVSGEEIACCLVVEFTGHDEPVNRSIVLFTDAGNALGKILEQGLVQNRSDGIGAFRTVKSETGSLTAGNRQRCGFPAPDQLHTAIKGLPVEFRLFRIFRCKRKIRGRREIRRNFRHRFLQNILFDELGNFLGF